MNEITDPNKSPLVMTSREIAELAGREHDNVRRDIAKLACELSLSFEEKSEASGGGRPFKVYLLPKRETLILVSGYSVAMRARIIDRWQELEALRAAPAPAIPQTLAQALRLAADQADQIEQQQAQLAIAAPKAQALDRIANADGSMCITDAAKHLQLPPKRLFTWLAANDWIYRRPGNANWIAYQQRLKAGVLDHKVTTLARGDGSEKVVEQVLVTAKGLAKLALAFEELEVA